MRHLFQHSERSRSVVDGQICVILTIPNHKPIVSDTFSDQTCGPNDAQGPSGHIWRQEIVSEMHFASTRYVLASL